MQAPDQIESVSTHQAETSSHQESTAAGNTKPRAALLPCPAPNYQTALQAHTHAEQVSSSHTDSLYKLSLLTWPTTGAQSIISTSYQMHTWLANRIPYLDTICQYQHLLNIIDVATVDSSYKSPHNVWGGTDWQDTVQAIFLNSVLLATCSTPFTVGDKI